MNRLCYFFQCLLFSVITSLYSQSLAAFDHQHKALDGLLKQIVIVQGHQSSVDYANLQANPRTLHDYLASLAAVTKNEFSGWTLTQQKAFLINAYNAQTLRLILSQYPDLQSIKDLGSFFLSPWKKKFFNLWGEKQHLDFIEHDLLRKNYPDPRLHFVLVCASRSCPPLTQHAYTADQLEQQLDHATRNFIRDTARNHYKPANNSLHLSSIFKWYRDDFTQQSKTLQHFVARWITDVVHLQKQIIGPDVSIQFNDYDWSLNDVR